MPKLVRPDDQPEYLDDFIDVFGNRARVHILGFLVKTGPSLRADIAKGTGLAVPTLGHHLGELERIGVLTVDLPPDQRRGRSVRYGVDQERLHAIKSAHERYLFGGDGDAPNA